MKLLLDTHILLWALSDDPALSQRHRAALETAEIYVSAASIWEIGIKKALGKLDVPSTVFDVAIQAGCRSLSITWTHAQEAAALPSHHADPFDRMLIAQARCDGLTMVSADKMFRSYDVELLN